MSPPLILEQPKELNSILMPAQRRTPAEVWRFVWLCTPFLVFMLLLLAETNWLKGRPILPNLAGACLIFPFVFFIDRWVQWLERRSNRSMRMDDAGLRLKPTTEWRVQWKHVLYFRLEPAEGLGPDKRLTVRYKFRGQSRERQWSMILTDPTQWAALQSELKKRQALNPNGFTIEILAAPASSLPEFRPRVALIWLYLLGVLFFVQGLPLLIVGLSPREHVSPREADKVTVPPRLKRALGRALWTDDLERFFITSGGALTGMGAVCCGLSMFLDKRRKTDTKTRDLVRC